MRLQGINLLSSLWWALVPLKFLYPPTRVHGVITHKVRIWIFTSMKTLILYFLQSCSKEPTGPILSQLIPVPPPHIISKIIIIKNSSSSNNNWKVQDLWPVPIFVSDVLILLFRCWRTSFASSLRMMAVQLLRNFISRQSQILSRVWETRDGIWVVIRIYCTLIHKTRKYM
jgi:hypothetical protein